MSKEDRKKMALETIAITQEGNYRRDPHDDLIELDFDYADLEKVNVITPQMVENILKERENNFINDENKLGKITVANMDSFEAAGACIRTSNKVLVLNFANAHHPGGGFINGASAQEETLCRNSTLFASINSDKAREMYDFNNTNPSAFDSDYMLLSPNVNVFRDCNGSFLALPYKTSVLTVPAPNRNGRAKMIQQDELDKVMEDKIRKILLVASQYEYDTLILGAWGCGAFGHDAEKVAGYFKRILCEEGYIQYFKGIFFAVYDKTEEQYNFKAFDKTFTKEKKIPKVFESNYFPYPFPCLTAGDIEWNDGHDYCIGLDLGYCYGIFNDGHPYIAEIVYVKEKNLKFVVTIFSAVGFSYLDKKEYRVTRKMIEERITTPVVKATIADRVVDYLLDGYGKSNIIKKMTEYLLENNVVSVLSEDYDIDMYVATDMSEEPVVVCALPLEKDGKTLAISNLEFMFYGSRGKNRI